MSRSLRTLVYLSFICAPSLGVAQTYVIPDPAFAAIIEAYVPAAITGNVLSTMHPDVLSLTEMSASYAGITSLDGLQFFTALETLGCFNNQITELPPLPPTLLLLDCEGNQITTLPTLPPGLESLTVSDNPLTALPPLPASLIYLDASNCQLTSLPALGPNLQDVRFSFNQLTTIPALPSSLIQLSCTNNQLTTLPALPADLYFLDCSLNQITSLPTLPNELEWFYCQNNLLTTIPNAPDSAVMIRCDHNLLDSLPSMANSAAHILMCYDNQLEELPELPPTLGQFWCNNNPLTCFPWLPNTVYNLNCMGTFLTCLPNIPTAFDSTAFWAEFPPRICDITASDCAIKEELITGTVFYDLNGDAVRDSGEPPFLLANVEAQPGDFLTAPDAEGNYVLHVDTGTFTLQGQPVLYHLRTTDPVSTTLVQDEADTHRDIGYQIIPGMYDVVADLASSSAQAGFVNPVNLGVVNVGTEATTATIVFTFDTDQDWEESDLVPDALVGQEATWVVPLVPGQLWTTHVYLRTDTTVDVNTLIDHLLVATIPQTDQTPANNSDTDPGIVLASMDPNDKRVHPETLTPEQVMDGTEVEYTIRFQNTGSASAHRVVITDTLSTDLLIPSMRFVSSSHACNWYSSGRVLYVIFNPIDLPDSTADEARSHGHVRFGILPRQELLEGTSVVNTANIFFDYNMPVITEPAVFSIVLPANTTDLVGASFLAFPNPFSSRTQLVLSSPLGPTQHIDMVDMNGRVVHSLKGSGNSSFTIQRQDLRSGMYLLRWLEGDRCLGTARVVLE